ncbi:RNA 2'-phosphotransferase [Actinomadura craniellae]|uniref:Probable RNA 2'-phosphotransferase n=1 Tax=Actinomadura craniellae TaxID=2231787 RepID=A0A365GZ53_9ACTN|nr:RNA 2'-phosphotransferase [Actinomadura craniellae]RAY12048.1 RNA 2'-phosphotransferase [Actinomadura craniellae]
MDERRQVTISKYLARHLRHRPERIGITLDEAGWTSVGELLSACARAGFPVTRAELEHVVAADAKGRYALDSAGHRIRANQGHSVPIRLGLPAVVPPDELFHGTVERALPRIRREGLRPMGRHDVHLSIDVETARRVGARRGRPVILGVDAAAAHAAGHEFRVTANGVWLVAAVPPEHLRGPFPEPASPPVEGPR